MPEYPLGVAILLTTTAVCSFGVFLISAREGKIQLPVNVREQESLLNDPFDVTTSEDALDGTPVDEDSFWRRMRLWKLAIVLLLAGVLISDCVSLGWAIVEEYQTDLTVCSLRVLFAFYVFLVSARALNQQYSLHSESVIHLFVLTFVATALQCTTAILPSSRSIGAAAFGDVSVPLARWYNALVLYTSAFLIVVNIPCGPPLHCPSERIYSDKTLMLVNTREEANVCCVTGASVWDILCFSYCAKVVMLGSSAESIEIADLPIVPADIRIANIYAGMRAAMRRWKLRIRDWCPKLDSGWELTYRLVRVNAHSLILIFILASISAAIFYLSAFFLRRIISYLEKDPWRTDKGWAWVYCAGLFFSNVFVQLLTGQLFSVSPSFARMLYQLSSPPQQSGMVQKERVPVVVVGKRRRKLALFILIDSPVEITIGTIFLYKLLGVSCFFGLAITCLFLPLNHFAGKIVVGAQEKLMKARDERVSLLNEFMAWEGSFEARVLKVRERELKGHSGASLRSLIEFLGRHAACCVNTNSTPFYWTWAVTRWLSACFNLLSSAVVGITGLIAILTPSISVSLAGFTLAFASTVTNDLLFLSRWFVALEQSMVEVERIKEFSEIKREPPEFVEQRPPASWPEHGAIKCENLVIRYAPELPNVPHSLSLEIKPSEKVEGRILIDDLDIAQLGLTDLRSKLTIIPQDPTILSGTLRSMLDVFDEYEDAEIYEALRCVHLIPSADTPAEDSGTLNANVNVFRNLESPVSEGGENFSTGEKQLLCMPRAILKCSRVLLMDEATASVDYATDELIGKTIRQEFADSTILTIAHRLRTVIDYDKIMLPEEGRIVEFDKPAVLLADPDSKFCSLCKATGKNEFAVLKAGVRS
ncbi:hypothetical protein SCP_0510070 [Sparassis crispa]|uniref:ABC transporter domain-containing protein n=1 Tax=Sparassis crispa TaxID=139825 RepID=A0A401GP02_9APHY|nr:hypothetical protein SCP_0510070 [Sparassis crispa]GBE83948.1 hypothetical protein SCP_0510070 [Sparassis crispa]